MTESFAPQSPTRPRPEEGTEGVDASMGSVAPIGPAVERLRGGESEPPGPSHVAVIMDGNGRWARRRGLPRTAGHRAGAKSVRETVEGAPELGVDTLTLYAFSADNWKRPRREVEALMDLFERYLAKEVEGCVENGVRVAVIGRRDRLRPRLVEAIEAIEEATRGGERLLLRLAVDYSARWAIAEAASASVADDGESTFGARLLRAIHSPAAVGPVDLLIRTGGERRLSDFLLWESAYAELYFTDCLWPDFGRDDLARAIAEFRGRERRFGAVPAVARAGGSAGS